MSRSQHNTVRMQCELKYLCSFIQELLALEEKMGNVSTALSEDALLKSVIVSTYPGISTEEEEATCNIKAEDTKCSICQVNYLQTNINP